MKERRAGEHEAVEQRDGQAAGGAAGERADQAARGREVDVDLVFDAGVQGRDDERLVVADEPDVADERLVEDGVDLLAVVDATLRGTAHAGPGGRGGGGHAVSLRSRLVLREGPASG